MIKSITIMKKLTVLIITIFLLKSIKGIDCGDYICVDIDNEDDVKRCKEINFLQIINLKGIESERGCCCDIEINRRILI